jgi:hypothetical protein
MAEEFTPEEIEKRKQSIIEKQSNGELEEQSSSEEDSDEEDDTSKKSPEKTEESKELKSALAQKKHFKDKYEEAKKKLEGLKKSDEISDMPSTNDPIAMVKLAKALEGFSEEEVDFMVRNAKDKSINALVDASKDDWVQTAIKAKREKVADENKTPEPSQSFVGSSEKTTEDIEKMSPKEFKQFVREQSTKIGRQGL